MLKTTIVIIRWTESLSIWYHNSSHINKEIMKLLKKILTISILVVLLSANAYAQSANQTANGFRVSPVRNDITIEKGKSDSVVVSVENPANIPLKATALINDFIASEKEDGEPRLLLDGGFANSHSFKRIATTVDNLEFAPKEHKDIKVIITIPANAKAGGYYGAIRFVTDTGSKSNLALTASVGSLFLVNVPGNIKENLSIIDFTAGAKGEGKKLITTGNVSMITRIKNTGDVHEQPFGKIIIKSSNGKTVSETEFNNTEPKSNILPDSTRKFENLINNKKWLGHYTASISLGYGNNTNELANATSSFWYIPIWLIFVAVVVLVVILAAIYVIYRKVRTRKNAKRRT